MLRMLAATLVLFAATGAGAQDWRGAASPYDFERLDSAGAVLARVGGVMCGRLRLCKD